MEHHTINGEGSDFRVSIRPDGEAELNVSVWKQGVDPEQPDFYSYHALSVDELALMVRNGPYRQLRLDVLRNLKTLRLRLESEMAENGQRGWLTRDQAALLADVCEAMGLSESDTYYVVGPAYMDLMDGRQYWPTVEVPASLVEGNGANA